VMVTVPSPCSAVTYRSRTSGVSSTPGSWAWWNAWPAPSRVGTTSSNRRGGASSFDSFQSTAVAALHPVPSGWRDVGQVLAGARACSTHAGETAGARHTRAATLGQPTRSRSCRRPARCGGRPARVRSPPPRMTVHGGQVGLAGVRACVLHAVAGLIGEIAEVDLPLVRRPASIRMFARRRTPCPCRWSR